MLMSVNCVTGLLHTNKILFIEVLNLKIDTCIICFTYLLLILMFVTVCVCRVTDIIQSSLPPPEPWTSSLPPQTGY